MLFPCLALIYAFAAAFRTVSDPDLGWQVATGRWIVQHHAIPSVDVLSYTGAGHPWIYPFLSQVILWVLSALGGYQLLTFFSTAACVATIALMLRGGGRITAILACIAVPIIAERTPPRAELFTEVLLAAFVSILVFYRQRGKGPLFLLPVLMVMWVNLHQGFIAGVAMCAAYVGLELEDVLSSQGRTAAFARLRTAWPWLVATVAATFVNPWTYRNYAGMVTLLPVKSTVWVQELNSRPVNHDLFREALSWRDPSSAVWWLVVAGGLAIVASLFQRRIVPAIILGVAIYANFHSVRLAGPFSIVAVVIAGFLLDDAALRLRPVLQSYASKRRINLAVPAAAVMLLVSLFAFVRVWDLVSNRYYMHDTQQVSEFGAGKARWIPERATEFIQQHHLPGNIFNDYTTGGVVAWKLSPTYPNYIDGRGEPFSEVFFHFAELLDNSLDSAVWRDEANRRNINTAIISLDHVYGAGLMSLSRFCGSKEWSPVYLDTQAAVFVRRSQQSEGLINSLQIDCQQVRFEDPPTAGLISGKADRFHYFLSAAAILNSLGRPRDGLAQLQQAESILQDSRDLYFMKGASLMALGQDAEGEKALRRCLEIAPYDAASMLLASKMREQKRPDEALSVLDSALQRSAQPHELYMAKGTLYLDQGKLTDALELFDRAEAASPFKGAAAPLGVAFNQWLATGREAAWSRLAEYYEVRGQLREAENARARAAHFANDATK